MKKEREERAIKKEDSFADLTGSITSTVGANIKRFRLINILFNIFVIRSL